jgi:hypothetical protein
MQTNCNQYRKEDDTQITLKEISSEDVCSLEVVQEGMAVPSCEHKLLVLSKVGNYLIR